LLHSSTFKCLHQITEIQPKPQSSKLYPTAVRSIPIPTIPTTIQPTKTQSLLIRAKLIFLKLQIREGDQVFLVSCWLIQNHAEKLKYHDFHIENLRVCFDTQKKRSYTEPLQLRSENGVHHL